MPAGRPTKFTPAKLKPLIDEYFEITPFTEWTITGLVLHCRASRDLFCEYELRPEFSDIIKRAKMMVENSYEKSLRSGGNVAGAIFALKQFGWRDKQEIDQRIEGNVGLDINVRFMNGSDEKAKD